MYRWTHSAPHLFNSRTRTRMKVGFIFFEKLRISMIFLFCVQRSCRRFMNSSKKNIPPDNALASDRRRQKSPRSVLVQWHHSREAGRPLGSRVLPQRERALHDAGVAAMGGDWRRSADAYRRVVDGSPEEWPLGYCCVSGYTSVLREEHFAATTADLAFSRR